jgi:hypothetical protein
MSLEKKLYNSKDIIPIYGGYKFYQRTRDLSEKFKETNKFKVYSIANGVYHGIIFSKVVLVASKFFKDYF